MKMPKMLLLKIARYNYDSYVMTLLTTFTSVTGFINRVHL